MRPRHPALPRRWLMTDERIGESLWAALDRLPRGSGVVFRHYATPAGERRALFARVAKVARRRGLVLVLGGDAWLGRGADGVHRGSWRTHMFPDAGRGSVAGRYVADATPPFPAVAAPAWAGEHGTQRGNRLRTASAHTRRELVAAMRSGADAVFVSPVFATRSHPAARALERVMLGLLVRGARVPVIALGGMTESRFRSLGVPGVHGWAAIDAWARPSGLPAK